MVERLLLVVAIAAFAGLGALLVRARARRRAGGTQGAELPAELRRRFPGGGPGIVYFYGPHCGPCQQQAVILERLASTANVPIVRIDAAVEEPLARRFNVMTAPVTVVVDRSYRVQAVNLGLQSYEELSRQVQQVAGA
jgi:thiol-disulfide isomerase/thioredoxin